MADYEQMDALKQEFCDYCVEQGDKQQGHLSYAEWLAEKLIEQRAYTVQIIEQRRAPESEAAPEFVGDVVVEADSTGLLDMRQPYEAYDDNPFGSHVPVEDGLINVIASLKENADAKQHNQQLDTMRSIAAQLVDLSLKNKERIAWVERERDSWKRTARAHENSTIERAKIIARLETTLNSPAPEPRMSALDAVDDLILKAADEIYYLDWRENDDDEKTAGWRHPGYFTEINVAYDFSKLVTLGMMERRDDTPTPSYRITDMARKYLGAGRRWDSLRVGEALNLKRQDPDTINAVRGDGEWDYRSGPKPADVADQIAALEAEADTDITNYCPQCVKAHDVIEHISKLVLMLTDVARGDWEQYQYTAEGRDVIIDRIDNQITHHLNSLRKQ